MIQELRIKNFLSFKDEVVFSFDASKDNFAEESQVVQINDNIRLLRFAVVYGYNASGKSNLLKAFDFLVKFWRNQPKNQNEPIGVSPFKLDLSTAQKSTRFELLFWIGKIKYWYQLELDNRNVYEENLYYYASSRPTMLFKRRLENEHSVIEYNNSLKVDTVIQKRISAVCLKNMSFFVARNQVNANIPQIDAAYDWVKHMLLGVSPTIDLSSLARELCDDIKDLQKYLLKFLNEADFNITNIKFVSEETAIPEDVREILMNSDILSQEVKNKMEGMITYNQSRTFFEHTVQNERGEEQYQLLADNEEEESKGTMRVFGLGAFLSSIIVGEAFGSIDEIETSLHPKLLEKLLYEYLKSNSKSQLIVTTHNDGLLDLVGDLFRSDSVWFTEKKKTGATEIYKLTDFRGVNRLSSIRDAYRNRRFGATMNI